VIVFASSVLPTPVGPARKATPRGRLPRRAFPAPVMARFTISSMCVTAASCPLTRPAM